MLAMAWRVCAPRVALVHDLAGDDRRAAGDVDRVARRRPLGCSRRPVPTAHQRRYCANHPDTAASASCRVNAPAYSALPTIAPSTRAQVGDRPQVASDETPPLATTAASVRAQTSRSRPRFGPVQRAVPVHVGDDVARAAVGVQPGQRLPQFAARPASSRGRPAWCRARRGRPRSARRARRSPRAPSPGTPAPPCPGSPGPQPVPSARPQRVARPGCRRTARPRRRAAPTTSASRSRFEPRPNAASRSTRWTHSAPAACQASAAASGSP